VNGLQGVIMHCHGEAVEPVAWTSVGAVINEDGFDRILVPEIDLPPRVRGILLRVGLTAIAEIAADVAVDCLLRVPAVRRILLRGLPLARYVAASAVDLDLGERQRLSLSGQLDAYIATLLY